MPPNIPLLEPTQCDPDVICAQIETGCCGKPFIVANFADPRTYWSGHLALLNEAFDGCVQMGMVPGGDNPIAFAFSEGGRAHDWERLEQWAGALADQFPPDFSALMASLREGAELRWAQAASAKARLFH